MITNPNRDFASLVDAKAAQGKLICMGLDPVWERLPKKFRAGVKYPKRAFKKVAQAFYEFCITIVDVTKDLVACYKPNAAFFEALGWQGEMYLEKLIKYIRKVAPDVVIIVDAKRGDIDDTNNGYVAKYFDRYKLDAVTVHPFLGEESLKSFLDREGKGVIVLCKTSNKGSGEFQDRMVRLNKGEAKRFGLKNRTTHIPLYQLIAHNIKFWKSKATLCVVVGATYPEHMAAVRDILPEIFILIPGVGKQGGDLGAAVLNGVAESLNRITINAGSAALYAWEKAVDQEDHAGATRAVVVAMNDGVGEALATAA